MGAILLDVLLDHCTPRAGNVPRINYMQNNVAAIQNLEQLSPNSLRLTLEKEIGFRHGTPVDSFPGSLHNVAVPADLDHARPRVGVVVLDVGLLGSFKKSAIAVLDLLDHLRIVLNVSVEHAVASSFVLVLLSSEELVELHAFVLFALLSKGFVEGFVGKEALLGDFVAIRVMGREGGRVNILMK